MTESCGNCPACRFFVQDDGEANLRIPVEESVSGYCHRYPPTADGEDRSHFPMVLFEDWCGEYEPRSTATLPAPDGNMEATDDADHEGWV